MLLREFHSPRSTACSSSSDGGSGSLRLSSARTRTLDFELKNAPSYHHAVMRLLPHAIHRSAHHQPAKDRSLTLQQPLLDAVPPKPQHGHRECLCDKERKHYRKDWRENAHWSSPPQKKMENLLHHLETHPDYSSLDPIDIADPNYLRQDHKKDSHFKSSSLYLEVKLAEMLSRNKHNGIDNSMPDANRVSMCWQLLGELSRMKTPFARVLSWIYQELDKSIYSGYVTAKAGSPTLQRVAYFELINTVKARKLDIEEERNKQTIEILACQNEIVRVEQEIKGLKDEVYVVESRGGDLEKKLTITLDSFQATIAQHSARGNAAAEKENERS